jgi:hypothetical protein
MTHYLHKVTEDEHFNFSPEKYSRFKYGSKSAAREFGHALGYSLSKVLPTDKQYVVIPAPYNFIPTATFALKDYVIAKMNKRMIHRGMKNPIQESKIFRTAGYNTDYGSMSLEDRRSAIGSEEFYTDKHFLKDKRVIFLDDIRVTGAHEERVKEMINRLQLQCECIFAYFAVVEGEVSPKVEDHLNHFAMKSLLDLDDIIKNDEFIFNTRNVKFMLAQKHTDFQNFIMYQSKRFRETLYSNLLGNGYFNAPEFHANISILRTVLTTHQ